jgi:pimeloyl-ACP methyl ester carboxylesterase
MIKWFILPGMGATSAMYDAVRRELRFGVNFKNWPEYRGEKSYAEVARRVIEENGISEGDVVGGSSLGGMVALEIARSVKAKAVILIGSAVHPREVQGLLSLLSPLAAVTPISLIQTLAGKSDNLVSSMFAESYPAFIRAMCEYLRSWQGYQGPAESVYRIHGRKDHVIPCPAGCDVIEGAGHLLAITHPQETGTFLEKVREQLAMRSGKFGRR